MDKSGDKKCFPGIVVLNWQNWDATIECINSIVEHVKMEFALIVVDNNSMDGSQEMIHSHLVSVFEDVGVYCHSGNLTDELKMDVNLSKNVIFVKNEVNGGYGAGNNIGIKIAYYFGCDCFWVLNNDCVLINDALTPMVQMIENHGVGFVGSVLEKTKGVVECYGGGSIFPVLGRTRLIKNERIFENAFNPYLMGASMLVARSVIDKVGYINESYFMYFEEIDWQFRGIKNDYSLCVASASRIIHKSGETKEVARTITIEHVQVCFLSVGFMAY